MRDGGCTVPVALLGWATARFLQPSRQGKTLVVGKGTLVAAGALIAALSVPALAQPKEHQDRLCVQPAVIGNDMRNSFELALDHLGRKMGSLPIRVIYEDDQQRPEVGRQKIARIAQAGH
jgi:branched-chain amino acid transport system substrate-binding protein